MSRTDQIDDVDIFEKPKRNVANIKSEKTNLESFESHSDKPFDDNSLFAKTGLQSGDFISRQAIQNLKFENPQEANLPNRVIRILTHIQ